MSVIDIEASKVLVLKECVQKVLAVGISIKLYTCAEIT
jgi:hypothetical protein